jgi:hypothetical protein
MSVTLVSLAQRITWQAYDPAGLNLVGPVYTIQTQNTELGKTVVKESMTNSESNGYAEFAPVLTIGDYSLSILIDNYGAWDAMFAAMDSRVFGQMLLYMTKPVGGNNPVIYTAKTLLEKGKMKGPISDQGGLWKADASGMTIGKIVRAGNDLPAIQGTAPGA